MSSSTRPASMRIWLYLSAALAFVIVATFPWDLQDHPHWFKIAWWPFITGIVRPHDLLLNAALYFPLGYLMPVRSRRARMAAAAVLAVVTSGALELAQVWSHLRFPSATDLVMNVLGSVAGAWASRRALP